MKQRIQFLITLFTRIVTTIIILASLFIVIFYGLDADFSVKDLLYFIFIGFLDTILYIPFLTEKELSKRKWFIMNVIYFLCVNISTVFIGYKLHWFSFSRISSFCSFECIILGTYSLVMFFFYKVDSNEAEKMNEKLKNLED